MTTIPSHKKFLVIDDNPMMRKVMRDILYTLEIENIVEANNAQNAIAALKKNKFDVILCDFNLGYGKNGLHLLEEIRHRKLLPLHTVFIMVTGEQSQTMVLGAMEVKPDEYLTKPFNPQLLKTRILKNFNRKSFLSEVDVEINRGNWASAIERCDALLKQENNRWRTQLLKIRADLAIQTGDYDAASKIYQDVLNKRELTWARLGLGIIYFQQKKYEQAEQIFAELVDKNPMQMECYDWLSQTYLKNDLPLQSEETLSRAIELSPLAILRQRKLAKTADKNQHPEISEQAYQAVVKLGRFSIHKNSADYAGLAKIYQKTGKYQKALETVDAMRSEYTSNPDALLWSNLLAAECFQNLGNHKRADETLAQLGDLAEKHHHALPKELQLDLAKSCFLNQQTEHGVEILDSLIKNHIDDETLMDDIKAMQCDIDRDEHAESLIHAIRQQLIDINNQGVKLFRQGQINEAITLFQQAVEKMPYNKTIILNMAKIALYDLKNSDFDNTKLSLTQEFIRKAKKIGVDAQKLNAIQLELNQFINQQGNANAH